MSAETRLATYGTLAPGQVNHGVVSMLDGEWLKGRVRGNLHEAGWGAAQGCPGMTPDPEGEWIDVAILVSADLPGHWDRLDAFEGAEYRRIAIDAEVAGEIVPSLSTRWRGARLDPSQSDPVAGG